MSASPTPSPLVSRYRAIKAQLPEGTLLFIRLGDFLEAFDVDATTVAAAIGSVMTKRGGVPMTGIPDHAQDRYFCSGCRRRCPE